eukprot:TRINITY_DN1247_c0_g1_i1.p1 TRINITY_DN1247_c0_g1~~TRINITY_DN1247_c0_g1_i1.p1  ORF type:complete len:412 (-),score=98.89 TRINITY_DN1247_c0_g1_i1:475-1710(-)
MSKGQFTMDNLKLASSTEVLNMLKKKGTEDEYILFSGIVDKVNRRGKHQTRVLLITNRAIYNLAENYKCKRRIAMEDVESMNIDQSQDEVVINVPKEYEYKFISDMREQIAVVLVQAVENYEKRKLQVTRTGSEHDKKEEETPIWRGEKVSLKDFSVLKLLGKGAFGEVYQVKKKDSGNVYAMKILSKQFIADNQKIEHTMVERTILAVFDNPFIMTLRFAFQTKTKLYLVMDYYHGGMLLSHLDKAQRFTEDQARFIVAEVACALGHLHSCNFIYRDLKPDNILMDLDGHICLTDFGLAKQVDPNNPYATTFVGTPDYIGKFHSRFCLNLKSNVLMTLFVTQLLRLSISNLTDLLLTGGVWECCCMSWLLEGHLSIVTISTRSLRIFSTLSPYSLMTSRSQPHASISSQG